MATAEEIFAGIAEADENLFGNYLRDGDYDLIIDRILLDKKQDGWAYIAEMYVEAARPVTVAPDMLNEGEQQPVPNSPGETASFIQFPQSTRNKSAKANIVRFVLAVNGRTGEKVDDKAKQQLLAESCEEGRFRGHRIKCRMVRKEKKNTPGSFYCKEQWTHVANTPEMVAEAIKILEGGAPAGKAPESGGSLLDAAK
jgi:hypothetical protein